MAALEERLRRVNEMYELGRIGRAEYDQKCADIEDQRTRIAAPPAPLFAQQQQVLTTLVDEWATMTTEERKRMLAAIFDSITASGEGVERLEPREDWRPYIVTAIPKPVPVPDRGCHRSGRRDSSPQNVPLRCEGATTIGSCSCDPHEDSTPQSASHLRPERPGRWAHDELTATCGDTRYT